MRYASVVCVGVFLMIVSSAVAQETTGGLIGTVTNNVGAAIEGAVVEAAGPMGRVSTRTGAAGKYRFPRLALGDYTVSVNYKGALAAETQVRVVLGEAFTVNFALQQGAFVEEIMVYSDTVAIDFTESQTASSVRRWAIDHLPRGRDYTDVVAFAAGVGQNNQAGGITVDGASGLENRYIIDGIDTTDPEIGTAAIPMRAEMMEEVQVKSAGYTAEYGGALGGVVNAVTRSGGNQFHGSVFADYENNSWNGSARPELERDGAEGEGIYTFENDDEKRYDPGFVLSGPILRDKWWFFASYQPGIRTTNRTVDWLSYPADTYTQNFDVDYASLNTTVNISSSLLLKAGLNFSPYTTDGLLPNRNGLSGLAGQENYAPLGVEGERETYYLTADWIVSDNFVVSGRGGFYHTNNVDTGVPLLDLVHNYSTSGDSDFLETFEGDIAPQWQQNLGFFSGNLQGGVNQENIYERTAAGIDATWFFQGAGDHSLKFGYQNEEIYNSVNSGYNADRILYYWDRTHTATNGDVVRGTYGNFRLLNISTFGTAKTNNKAVFIQDSWTVLPNLTLNLGLRFEDEEVPNYGATGPNPAISFGWGDKIAPRLGFAWDVTGNAKWKLYGGWGTYYDVTKYEMPRGSFGGDKWVDFWFTFDTSDPGLNDASTCRTGSNTVFERPVCPAGTLYDVADRRLNSADPATWEILGYPNIEPNMKPMEGWEAQIGLDHQLTSTIQVGARYVHKEIVRTIEDVGLLYPGVGEVYIIANPSEGVTAGYDLPYVKPVREYDALELGFHKRFSDGWALGAHYTLSRLWGNYSGLANSDENNSFGNPLDAAGSSARLSPNVSRLWDVAGSAYDQNGDPVYGRLATDRRHRLGAGFLYSFDFGLSVGVFQSVGSGTPISTMGSIPTGNAFYPYGRGDLGETPWITSTNLTLLQTFNLGKNLALSVGLTVLNLFDEDTATRKWTNRTLSDISVEDADFLTGFDYAALEAELGPTELDGLYGEWDTFQLPRNIRLTVKLEF